MLVVILVLLWCLTVLPIREPWRMLVAAIAIVCIALFAFGIGVPWFDVHVNAHR